MISNERYQELKALYEELKKQCLLIDEKYSLSATEPHLDLPDSLNLQKLTFVPKSEEELNALAEQKVAAVMISKERSAQKSYASQLKSLSAQRKKIFDEDAQKRDKALDELTQEKATVERKVIDNGLYFSNVANKYVTLANEKYNNTLKDIGNDTTAQYEYVTQQEQEADNAYNDVCASLEEERKLRVAEALRQFSEQEEKESLAIEKYNNSLEEKEQRYQYSKAKSYEAAYRAQQNKALQNAKIYAQLGETGYREMIEKEKFLICKTKINPLTREEGNILLTIDTFLRESLGNYYSTLVDWINTVLPA